MVGEERFYGLILLLAHVQLCDDFCKTQLFFNCKTLNLIH